VPEAPHRGLAAIVAAAEVKWRILGILVGVAVLLLVPSAASATALPSTIGEDMTLTAAGNPYTGSTTIESGVTLKVEPGVKFKINSMVVKGTLDVDGTAEEPVVFTGAKESSAGEWAHIVFESGSGASVIDHTELAYGGGSGLGAIWVNGSSPTITNSTIRKSYSVGINVEAGGSPEIASNDLLANASGGITYSAAGTKTGQVNIHDNFIEGGLNGIYVNITSTGSVVGKNLGGNTIVKTTKSPLFYKGLDIPGNITGNTLIENSENLIKISSGTVASSSTWNDGGSPVKFEGSVTVASGVTLKITKGVLIKNPAMVVKGTLLTEGTAEEPVVLTGVKEEAKGEWAHIVFESGSGASVIDHTEVAYGGSGGLGNIWVNGSSPTITNSTIRKSYSVGINVEASGAPKIEWNRFRGNANGLTYSGTGELSAPNNDWGCASGPKPAGCGDSVIKVKWNPAIQLPELNGQCSGKESQCGEGADPVSLATGDLSYSHRDLLLTNKSHVPLELSRSYYSGSAADTGLGPGWSQTGLASATELASGAVLIMRQDGRQDLFVKTESGYKAPSGVTSALAKVEGTFQLTTLENTVYRFDASGRIASITDDHGLKTTYGYDANGRLATITDPSSQTLTFSYNASNHITSVKDSTGREVKYTYSGAGDLAMVTDALGGVTEYTYDSEHRLKTIKDPRGNVILKNTFDGQGRVVEQLDGLENLWKLEYKEDETIVTEPEGGKITYGFDGQDRVVSEKDQLGHITTTSYDEAGNIDEIVKPGGAKWQFGHDGDGNLTSVIDPEEGERSYEYDGKNRLTEFTDEREETWAYEWSEANDLKKITDPAEGEITATYNASGQPLTVTDPNEHTTTFTYDTRGNRLTAKDALEHTTVFAYSTRNHLTSKTAPGLAAETYGRNALGDLLSVTTPEGSKTEYAYDANGMPKQITDPAENLWKIERNAMERPTAYVDPLGKETKIEYDGNFNAVKVTDRRSKETTYAYDLANQLTGMERPEGGDWEFDYDARGNRIEAVEPRENATTYEYDLLDRMTEAAEPLEATTSYEYDPAGNLVSFTDPRENQTELVYDELGRLTELKQPLGKVTSFGYDGVGNRTSRTTAEGTVDFAYDAVNRLEEVSDGESMLRSFDYDPSNRLTGAVDAQSDEIEIGYDDDGRVVSIDDGRGQAVSRKYDSRGNVIEQVDGRGTLEYGYDKLNQMISLIDPQSKALGFDYDPEGNLTEVELPNGVVTTNEYDNSGRLAETTAAKGETTLESLDYEYDPFGNRIAQVDRLSQETAYGYDALNRLTEFDPPGEGSTSYGYDPAGNRIEAGATSYSFNDLNQLTNASNGTTYDYDDAGRLIEVNQGEASMTYDWSVLDELASADTGALEIDYAYDAFGRQVLRDDGATSRPSHYGDLSDRPILDTDAEGQPTMSYVQGPAGLVEQRSGEATVFPLRNARGDITAIGDEEAAVVSRQDYDPWGAQISGPAIAMGFLGAQQRRSDAAIGLVQMGVRTYASDLGRFLSEDPIVNRVGLSATSNRYPYGSSNPLNRNDLDGRETCVPTPFGTACAPVTVHVPVPTPSDPIPDLPVTIDGVPTPAGTIDKALPNPPAPGVGEMAGSLRDGGEFLADRALSFFKEHGAGLATGCVTGGAGGFLAFNAMTGGAPVFIPGIGWLTEGGSAIAGCVVGAAGMATAGVNPVRRN
jgi:RHS repeat-associated protein